jgi:hypothetical protein
MFEGLDDIDWASLTHAFGSAEDVPGLLRARASQDPKIAEEAEGEFFGNIWHQGTVYEATAYAVPYLVELLMRQETHDRFGLVVLLAFIAKGTSYMEVHDPYVHYMVAKPELKDRLARELRWKAEARAAVEARAHDYWRLMDVPDVRITIPYLLAKLPGEAARICQTAPLFVGSQNDALCRASMLMCWATWQPAGEAAAGPFVTLMQNAETPLLQLCAALGVLRIGAPADVDEALRVYFDALHDESAYDPKDTRWFWGEGDVSSLLLKWVLRFGPAAKEAALLWLPPTLPRLEGYTAAILAAEALPWAFTADQLPRRRSDLTALQFSLLQTLSRQTNVIHQDLLIKSIMAALGLPNDMKRLKAFLE